MAAKERVREHWEEETAGIRYGEGDETASFYRSIEQRRYVLEPYIPEFAQFEAYAGKRVLEVGVGGGVDFSRFVRAGATVIGIDLTAAGIAHTNRRLSTTQVDRGVFLLAQADAEDLPLRDDSLDLVYSWGVLHHTPDTPRALAETFRVLKPGGVLKAMIYHTPSWTGFMLWARHALLKGRPFTSARRSIYEHLESPGTKAYTVAEAEEMLAGIGFTWIRIATELGPGDLLTINPSKRYQGLVYRLIWALYPRWLVRLLGNRFGLGLLLMARKPENAARGTGN